MSITRWKLPEHAEQHHSSLNSGLECERADKYFSKNVFGEREMKSRLPKDIYSAMRKTMDEGVPLDFSVADVVATAMSSWAVERGATHYAHIFYPLTGSTAERHDSFYSPDGKGGLVTEFSGAQLIQGEPDASSFPNGGLRATFEARGYTAWDVTSPAYLMDGRNGTTLCIPTAFCSWNGQALDKKVPLLRSMQALNKQVKRVLKVFGQDDPGIVTSSAGPEQEYFLIDRALYFARPDLICAGRTLFGAPPAKGQQLDDQYFGTIPERVLAYMMEVDSLLYKLGIPVKTRHNEVAPAQYEIAPVFESSNLANDHQQLLMHMLQSVAPKYGLVCLVHEKPFAGVNGSGKHVNWSIGGPTVGSLLSPGDTPHENMQFLVFCAAIVMAVNKHAVMLRGSVAYAGNDHRLGANEAPPAIISVFLGEQLDDVFQQIAAGGAKESKRKGLLTVGVDTLPALPKDATDRNRTSPFAFTGNRFEFRAVGSSQSISGPQVVINTIVAEALDYVATELEQAPANDPAGFNTAVQRLLQRIVRENSRIIFNGDNYSAAWAMEAEKRGLPNNPSTPGAFDAMDVESTYAVFEKYDVLSREETASRFEIYREKYVMDVMIEANMTFSMAKTMIFPAVVKHQKLLADTIIAIKNAGVDACNAGLQEVTNLNAELQQATAALEQARELPDIDLVAQCHYMADTVIPAMNAVRAIADKLEGIVADEFWPLPTYQEILFTN
ncbi:MAG: glutamine synthetase III [Kiritimatiellia bacterium]